MAQLADDWSYQLAEAMLTAAVSCGATCERRFVSPSLLVEGPPPGCTCQLVATVTEGWEPARAAQGVKCARNRVATVRLTLDLCTPAAGKDEVPDPVKWQTAARDAASTRWQMMAGLERARQAGEFCGHPDDGWPAGTQVGCCSNVTPDAWRATRSDWGSARWETTWVFRHSA